MSRLTVPVGKRDHIKGNPKARVTVLEYGDFECPHCGAAYPIVESILDELGDRVRFAYRHFPLSQVHPHATQAAYAAESAGKRNNFWGMHSMLFEHQDALEDTDLVRYAEELELDTQQFLEDMESNEVIEKVREDFLSGIRSGVNGTPTFFINGHRHDGSYTFDELVAAIVASEGRYGHA